MWLIINPDKYKTYKIGDRDESGKEISPIDIGIPIKGKGDSDEEVKRSTELNRRLADHVLTRYRDAQDGVITVEEVERSVQEIVARAARANTVTTTAHVMIEWVWSKVGQASSRMFSMLALIENILTFFSSKAEQNPARIIRGDLQMYFDGEASSGSYRRASIKDHIKTVKSIFRHAKEELRIIGLNPAAGLKLPVGAIAGLGRAPFSVEEVRKLLRFLKTIGETGIEWVTLVLVASYTAMRLVDALNLTWEEIDFDKQEICFSQEKLEYLASRGIHIAETRVPIHDELLRRLMYHRDLVLAAKLPLTGYIMPFLQSRGEDRIGGAFIKLLKKAGISTHQKKQKEFGRKPMRRGFHSFRHAVITWMKLAGVAKELRMEFAGHSENSKDHDTYDHAKNDTKLLRKHVLPALPILESDATDPAMAAQKTADLGNLDISSIPTSELLLEITRRCTSGTAKQ